MIREIEELSMSAWPSLQTKLYDGWVLIFADGYTKRANSVNPSYESTIPLSEKIDYCEKEYGLRNVPIVFKLTPKSFPKGIDTILEERGYSRVDETSVRLLEMRQYNHCVPEGIIIETVISNRWFDGFCSCSNLFNEKDQSTARKILENILGNVIFVTKQVEDKIVGCGYGAIERGYIGIFDVVVDKSHRRKGYGKDIIDGILGTVNRISVKTAYLQVVVGNVSAEKLYDKIGFKEAYRYWYRKLELKY